MASYPPPSGSSAVYNNSNFFSTADYLTVDTAKSFFLQYPTAQGTENLLNTYIAGNLDITGDISLDSALSNLTFYDTSTQSSAYTGAKTLAGSYTNTNMTIDSNGKITALASGSTGTLSTTLITPNNSSYGVGWNSISSPANTQYADMFVIGGGGIAGNWDVSTTFGLQELGGSGGSGAVININNFPMGTITNGLSVFINPQYVWGDTLNNGRKSHTTCPEVWTGTFTQTGNTITIVSTTSGAISVGSIITYTLTDYDTTFPTASTPYGATYNQLIIYNGSGSTWNCLPEQTQTISTALPASAYTPVSAWEGTITQSGNTITANSTISGNFSNIDTTSFNYYMITYTGTYKQQALTSNTTVNKSQTLNAVYAKIIIPQLGTNYTLIFNNFPDYVNSAYTESPYIAWCEGGGAGQDGNWNQQYAGAKGYGGVFVNFVSNYGLSTYGADGLKGILSTDAPFNAKTTYNGGTSSLLYGQQSTINGKTIGTIGKGGSWTYDNRSGSTVYYTILSPDFGGVILTFY